MKEDDIRQRWQEYFDKLFNGENENSPVQLDDSFDDNNRRFERRIQESEVREALKRMKGSKAMGPNGIPIKHAENCGASIFPQYFFYPIGKHFGVTGFVTKMFGLDI